MLDEIIFGQIRPSAVFYVIRRSLMVGIFLHGTAGNRQFVHTARADRRSRLAAQNNLLWELLIILLILVRTIVESGYIHHGSHIVIYHGVGSIHALSDRACRVFTVADVLQETGEFRASVAVPLVGNLVSDTPHHHTGVVAELMKQIY